VFEKCGEELFVVDLHGRGIDGVVCRELVPDDHDLVAVKMMNVRKEENQVLRSHGTLEDREAKLEPPKAVLFDAAASLHQPVPVASRLQNAASRAARI